MSFTGQVACDGWGEAARSGRFDFLGEGQSAAAHSIALDELTFSERDILENELALAARIQESLLPRHAISVAGWKARYRYDPAGLFSGDYCDLIETERGLLFLLGDVSGKGLGASMLMTQLHATFRSLAGAQSPLAQMVETANRGFSRNMPAGLFATLVAGMAAPDGSVEMISAGHMPILHLGESGVRNEAATGIPLGIFHGAQFQTRRITVAPGETLFVFTDGITEARNASGQEYGFQRLQKIVSRFPVTAPDALIRHCLHDLADFTGRTKQADDLTLLAVRREP